MPLTEDDVKEAVLNSASENSALLVKLAETEEAPGNLALHTKHISRLRDDLEEQKQALEQLRNEVEAKLKIHKKFNNNATRKFFYRASFMRTQFEAKATKGEQEYFSVLASRSKAEERHMTLQNELNGAERKEPALYEKALEHGEIHGKIDELYESLFAGPTPGFNTEDSLENRFYAARGNHETVKSKIVTARQAARQLKVALNNVKRADKLLDAAEVEANNSFLIFDEASYSLSRSNKEIEYALSALLRGTDTLQPKTYESEVLKNTIIRTLKRAATPTRIPSSREAFTAAIAKVKEPIEQAQEHLKDFIMLTKKREEKGLEEIKKTARTLEDSRQALHQSRMSIFEEVAGFGQAAPAYNECCDRADDFCQLPPPPPEEPDDTENGSITLALPDYSEATEEVRPEERGRVSPISHD